LKEAFWQTDIAPLIRQVSAMEVKPHASPQTVVFSACSAGLQGLHVVTPLGHVPVVPIENANGRAVLLEFSLTGSLERHLELDQMANGFGRHPSLLCFSSFGQLSRGASRYR